MTAQQFIDYIQQLHRQLREGSIAAQMILDQVILMRAERIAEVHGLTLEAARRDCKAEANRLLIEMDTEQRGIYEAS
jgi:hypothetical protein